MTQPHLTQLPDLLRALDPPVDERVLALVDEEYGRWRNLHDRLVALIVELLDVASEDRPVASVISSLIDDTTVGIDSLVGHSVDATEIAALLRAHGSRGTVTADGDTTVFRHLCGSGGHYWREHPDVAKVVDGEVDGVAGGHPRYCARCVRSIAAHGGSSWVVTPPDRAEDPCTWTVTS